MTQSDRFTDSKRRLLELIEEYAQSHMAQEDPIDPQSIRDELKQQIVAEIEALADVVWDDAR